MKIDFDHNLRLLPKDKDFLEKKLLKDSLCRGYISLFGKHPKLIYSLQSEIEKKDGVFAQSENLTQSDRIDRFYSIIKKIADDYGVPLSDEKITRKKRQEITLAPRIIDNFINTESPIVDKYFSLLLNENYKGLQFWELNFFQKDMFHFYCDFIGIDSNHKVILGEIKVDDTYTLDQYLKYLRIYRDAIGIDRLDFTNIKHVLISSRNWENPFSIAKKFWTKSDDDDSKSIVMNAEEVNRYINTHKSSKGKKIRKILSSPTLEEADITNFKIYFRNYTMLFDTAKTLEREHGVTNKSFINNLEEIMDLSKR